MRKIILLAGILIGLAAMFLTFGVSAQNLQTHQAMKLNAGIITPKLKETKAFYTDVLNFGVTFENEFYLLMHTPDQQAQISFLLPDHPTQRPIFQPAFGGKGVFLTIEVENVDAEYQRIKALRVPIAVELRDEPWGDRHFAIADPNGVGTDIVTYRAPSK
jgi:catechol 2,3-dioxygenase-like lactoylglutathione lyase family enzyme